MKKNRFARPKSVNAPPADINIDFGAASSKIPRVFPPEMYDLEITESSVRPGQNGNVLVVLDLVELESGAPVRMSPLWVDGPNAGAGPLAAENQHVIAQLLEAAGLPTSGNVGELIPKLKGLKFTGRLSLPRDDGTGRTSNTLVEVFSDATQ